MSLSTYCSGAEMAILSTFMTHSWDARLTLGRHLWRIISTIRSDNGHGNCCLCRKDSGKYRGEIHAILGENFRGAVLPAEFDLDDRAHARLVELTSRIVEDCGLDISVIRKPADIPTPNIDENSALQRATQFLASWTDQSERFRLVSSKGFRHCWAFSFKTTPASFSNIAFLVDKGTGDVFARRYIDIEPMMD